MKTKITYHPEGDYLIPDLVPPKEPRIGVWGRRRKQYLRQYRDPIYTGLLLSGKLKDHLEEIDQSDGDGKPADGGNGPPGRGHREIEG